MNWDERAACRGTNTSRWFPGHAPTAKELAWCQAICRTCPVQPECLEEGMRPENITVGIWAGTTPAERLQTRRERSQANRLFLLSEIAQRFGLDANSVRKLHYGARFKAWKIGRLLYARPEDVWNAAKLGEKRKASA